MTQELSPPTTPIRLPAPRTCPTAVVALVLAVLAPVVGVVLGVVARRRIRRTGERGRGMATAAVWVGSVLTALGVAAAVTLFVLVATMTPSVSPDIVAGEIAAKMNLPADAVSCPGSLEGTVGTTMTCTATTPTGPTAVHAVVTSYADDTVNFDISVG